MSKETLKRLDIVVIVYLDESQEQPYQTTHIFDNRICDKHIEALFKEAIGNYEILTILR